MSKTLAPKPGIPAPPFGMVGLSFVPYLPPIDYNAYYENYLICLKNFLKSKTPNLEEKRFREGDYCNMTQNPLEKMLYEHGASHPHGKHYPKGYKPPKSIQQFRKDLLEAMSKGVDPKDIITKPANFDPIEQRSVRQFSELSYLYQLLMKASPPNIMVGSEIRYGQQTA